VKEGGTDQAFFSLAPSFMLATVGVTRSMSSRAWSLVLSTMGLDDDAALEEAW
jgi:hypothetical protein